VAGEQKETAHCIQLSFLPIHATVWLQAEHEVYWRPQLMVAERSVISQ